MADRVSMNALDRVIAALSPRWAVDRIAARHALAAYEAAKPSKLRRGVSAAEGPNVAVRSGQVALMRHARHLEQNHDLFRGALSTLVDFSIGPSGVGIEPQPRRADGTIHAEYAEALRQAWRDWTRRPEVTWQHSWARVQRLAARSWLRDGEVFAQKIVGPLATLNHGTRVPFSLELIEAEMCPVDHADGDRIRQGIERNSWGRPTAYFFWKSHPLEMEMLARFSDLKRVPAERLIHLKTVDRIGQVRGVSHFASIITRIEDLKDYEESERIAAKVAASLTAYVRRGTSDLYDPARLSKDADGNPVPRDIRFAPGMVIDTLAPGEDIGLIDSKRPNVNAVAWRQGQLKAMAAGIGASFSTIAREYGGTYSSQRQELVESWLRYSCIADDFTTQFVQPVWEAFVAAADLGGVVPMPRDVVPESADDALWVATEMPWIDPVKEAAAWVELTRAGFASEVEVIRKRGGNPRDVMEQIASFRADAKARDLVFTSDAASSAQPAAPAADAPDPPPAP